MESPNASAGRNVSRQSLQTDLHSPEGGLSQKEAVPEGVSCSSSDAGAAAAVLTALRTDDNGTIDSLETLIMKEASRTFPHFSPSAFGRATGHLIAKELITARTSQDNQRARYLRIASDTAGASARRSSPATSSAQHDIRSSILALEFWSRLHAATPSFTKMNLLIEFNRLIDQKIFVPSDSSTPGMVRVTIQVGAACTQIYILRESAARTVN
ncbi:hypothetical protein T484DRAFT_1860517 [Baffinella frigidus]|nr:hypothetical protein T484DRAFT_1860517 [Cryptophyta sp. CCMP2293]